VAARGPGPVVAVLDGDAQVAVLRVRPGAPDLAVVDVVARLHLVARRRGWSLRLCDPGGELRALLALVGLAEVGREAEGGEELGEEVVVDGRDAAP
jgi:hypothetical protein